MKIGCVIGTAPQNFPWSNFTDSHEHSLYTASMIKEIDHMITINKVDYFLCCIPDSAATDQAKLLLEFRCRRHRHIKIEVLQLASRMNQLDVRVCNKSICSNICASADCISILSHTTYQSKKSQIEIMIQAANVILIYWSGHHRGAAWEAIEACAMLGKTPRIIPLTDFIVTVDVNTLTMFKRKHLTSIAAIGNQYNANTNISKGKQYLQ